MKYDLILAGVGGQGVLSVAAIIAQAAVASGLKVRQSEVHGMAQRGGTVLAHLRLSTKPIASDLVPQGGADLILAMEPLESLRYIAWLSPNGALVTAAEAFDNIDNYPSLDSILAVIHAYPQGRVVAAASLAKQAGLIKAINMVMVGAASAYLPLAPDLVENTICDLFATKEPSVIEANIKAFRLGRAATEKS